MKFKTIDKKILIPIIIAVIGSLLMVISIFLPITVGTESLKAEIANTPNINLSPSMLDYAIGFNQNIAQVVIVALIGGFAVLSLIFSAFKKAVVPIILTAFSLFVFAFQCFDFTYREIINQYYTWGYAYYLFYAATAISLLGSVWLLIAKLKDKKVS